MKLRFLNKVCWREKNSQIFFFKMLRQYTMYYGFMDKAFVFDMDGTLGETVPLAIEAIKAAFQNLGLPVPSREEIVSHFGPTEKGLFQMMDEKNCGRLYAEYLKAYAELHDKYAPKPFDGIESILKKISSAGMRLGIVTGKSRDSAKITLEKFGLGGYFSEVACGGPTGSVKTQRILGLAKKWEIPAENIYYVGDSPQDILDARQAGAHPLSAAWSRIADRKSLESCSPEVIFETVGAFGEWIDAFIK